MTSSAMPMATASPWRRRYSDNCSSLWAAQWPKSSGGRCPFEGIAPGGDVVQVQFRAAKDQGFMASGSNRASAAAWDSIHSKKARSRMQATFTASIAGALVPFGQRGEQVEVVDHRKRRREGSDEILFPEGVDPVLTPTPESSWARVVVGMRTCRTPRWAVDAARPTMSKGAAADGDHVVVAVDESGR